MPELLVLVLDFALFCATVLWVGRKPTAVKVTAMIVAVAAVHFGIDMYDAMLQGVTLQELYLGGLDEWMEQNQALLSGQEDTVKATMQVVATCLPSFYVVQAAALVFCGLCIAWVFERGVMRSGRWTAFSQVDLPVWTVVPLIAGLLLYAISTFPTVPFHNEIFTVAVNVLVVSVIPLFVQGAAACKGIADKAGFSLMLQLLLAAIAVVSGAFAIVFPLVGLLDYWANLRKLERDVRK